MHIVLLCLNKSWEQIPKCSYYNNCSFGDTCACNFWNPLWICGYNVTNWQSFPTCKHFYIWKSKIFLEIDIKADSTNQQSNIQVTVIFLLKYQNINRWTFSPLNVEYRWEDLSIYIYDVPKHQTFSLYSSYSNEMMLKIKCIFNISNLYVHFTCIYINDKKKTTVRKMRNSVSTLNTGTCSLILPNRSP